MSNATKRQLKPLICVLAVVIFFLVFQFVYKPKQDLVLAEEDAIVELEKEEKELLDLTAQKSFFEDSIKKFEAKILSLSKGYSPGVSNIETIVSYARDIESKTNQNVLIQNISMSASTVQAQVEGTDTQAGRLIQGLSTKVTFEMISNYQGFKDFATIIVDHEEVRIIYQINSISPIGIDDQLAIVVTVDFFNLVGAGSEYKPPTIVDTERVYGLSNIFMNKLDYDYFIDGGGKVETPDEPVENPTE